MVLVMVSIVVAVSTYEYNDPLTRSIGDRIYCQIGGVCNFTSVQVQNVTGDLNLNGFDINTVDEVFANYLYGLLDWSNLTNVPAGLDDGDNDTQLYTSAPELYVEGKELYFNQTYNNLTIGSISEVKEYEDTFSISVSGGEGTALSSLAIDFSITRVTISPPNNSTAYRFQAVEQTGGEVIDKDRIPHRGVWDIRKSHALDNDYVNATITNAVTDGTYNVKITYLDNYT